MTTRCSFASGEIPSLATVSLGCPCRRGSIGEVSRALGDDARAARAFAAARLLNPRDADAAYSHGVALQAASAVAAPGGSGAPADSDAAAKALEDALHPRGPLLVVGKQRALLTRNASSPPPR